MIRSAWWKPLAIWAAHLAVLAFAVWIGFYIEVLFSGRYQFSRLAAFAPWMAATSCAFGFFINRARRDRIALFVWVAGLALLAFAIEREARLWNPAWIHESRKQYVIDVFFGDGRHCPGSECIAQLFFTAPCTASIAYSLGAAIGLLVPSRRGKR